MKKLAIFDFDGTLFTKDTLPYIGKVWKKQTAKVFSYYYIYLKILPSLILYKLKIISRESLKSWAVNQFHQIFKNMTAKEIQQLFYNTFLLIKPSFNSAIIQEIKAAQKEGYHTVLLSGCYTDLLKIIAEHLNIDTVLGMDLPLQDGKFNDQAPLPFINGETKQRLLANAFRTENIDWHKSRSYADSITDLPVLLPVGEPVAVNPEPQLAKFAMHNQWRILR